MSATKNSRKSSRKNIRKIIKNVDLSHMTKIAVKNERERKLRVKEREKMVRTHIRYFSQKLLVKIEIMFFVCFVLVRRNIFRIQSARNGLRCANQTSINHSWWKIGATFEATSKRRDPLYVECVFRIVRHLKRIHRRWLRFGPLYGIGWVKIHYFLSKYTQSGVLTRWHSV